MSDVNKINCVYLDMDGVIANLSEKVLSLWGLPAQLEEEIDAWDAMPRVVSKHVGFEVTAKSFWATVNHHGSEFFRDINPYPWAKDLYETCDAHVPVVLMTTAISPAAAMGKMQWMDQWFPDAKRHAITPCKHHFARPNALLIDDAPHNVEAFQKHGGQVFQWPMPWNGTTSQPWHRGIEVDAIAQIGALLEGRASIC